MVLLQIRSLIQSFRHVARNRMILSMQDIDQ
jgi:hypothetical protein